MFGKLKLRRTQMGVFLGELLTNKQIDICKDGKVIKTIKRHIRCRDRYRPNVGTIELQGVRAKVFLVNYSTGSRWKCNIEDNSQVDASYIR
jgi:hypothetical protein